MYVIVFVCLLVYELFGIVNFEVMVCEIVVVVSGVGGIFEVVVDGVTGLLVFCVVVMLEEFEVGLVDVVNVLCVDLVWVVVMGKVGCEWVVYEFSWEVIVYCIVELYEFLLSLG